MAGRVELSVVAKNQASSVLKQIGGDIRGLGKEAGSAKGALGQMFSVAGGGRLARGIQSAASAVAGLGKAFVGAVADMTMDAAAMNAQVSGIGAVLGLTTAELGKVKGLINDLGVDPNLKVNATEAANAIDMLARNGLNLDQILGGAARATVFLANATGGTFDTSANVATDAMAMFKIKAEDMMTAVDGITSVTVASKFGLDDYQRALSQAGGVASALGVEFDDFNTTIAATSSSFASGSDAGTSYKTFLQRLVPQSNEAVDAMGELGLYGFNAEKAMSTLSAMGIKPLSNDMGSLIPQLMNAYAATNKVNLGTEEGVAKFNDWARQTGFVQNSFYDANGQMKSMADISATLNEATAGLTEEQKNQYLTTIFGSDAMRTAFGLAEKGQVVYTDVAKAAQELGVSQQDLAKYADGGITAFEALQATMGKTDALKGAQMRVDNLSGDMEIFSGIVDSVRMQIGDKFDPVLRGVFQGLTSTFTSLTPQILAFGDAIANNVAAGVQRLSSAFAVFQSGGSIADIGAALGLSPTFIGMLEAAYQNVDLLVGALKGIGVALGVAATIAGVTAAITGLLNPITLVIGGAALLGAAWETNFGGIQEKTQAVIDFLRPGFEELSGWITSAASGDFSGLQAGLQGALQTVTATIEEFKWSDFVTTLDDWATYIAPIAWDAIVPVIEWATYIAPIAWDTVVTTLADWGSYITSLDWASIITTAIDWATWIPALSWTAIITAFEWSSYIAAFEWSTFVTILDWATVTGGGIDWSAYIASLDWAAIITTTIDWGMWVTLLPWNTFVAALDWSAVVAVFAWNSYISRLDWSTVTTALTWESFVTALTDWGAYIASLDWSGYIATISDWSAFIGAVAWSSFIANVDWPTFVPVISWSSIIPAFPGWDGVLDYAKSFVPTSVSNAASSVADTASGVVDWITGRPGNAAGTDNWKGGWTWVGERGPELLNLPKGSQILSNTESKKMIGQMADGTTTAAATGTAPRQNVFSAISAAAAQFGQSAKELGKTLKDTSKDLESSLRKVPGLFGTSQVTDKQQKMADLGIPQNFADDWIRRLTDEVVNGVDWEGVDIKDAAMRAGLDPALPAEAILELVTDKWNDKSLFADPQNLDLINQDAVKAALAQQAQQKLGEQNMLGLFGITPAQAGAAGTATGTAAGGGMLTGITTALGVDGGAGTQVATALSTGVTPESMAPVGVAVVGGLTTELAKEEYGTQIGAALTGLFTGYLDKADSFVEVAQAIMAKISNQFGNVTGMDIVAKFTDAFRAQLGTDDAVASLARVGEKILELVFRGYLDEARKRNWAEGVNAKGDTATSTGTTTSATTTTSVEAPAASGRSRLFADNSLVAAGAGAGGGNVYVTVNASVGSDIDINKLAYQIADVIRRRR